MASVASFSGWRDQRDVREQKSRMKKVLDSRTRPNSVRLATLVGFFIEQIQL